MRIQKELDEIVKSDSEWKNNKIYESLTDLSERILPIYPGKNLEKKYKEAIDFCHMNASPTGVFSLAIVLTTLTLFVPIFLMLFFNSFSIFLVLLVLFVTLGVFFYFYNYPFSLATSFRIKASSEMVLAIIYMTIAMKVRPNLEHAVKYAATNLRGPLSVDLKRLLWDVYIGKFLSMEEALEYFSEKWKRENEEFTESISLIKTAFHESPERMDRMFSEAVNCMLDGTKERMKGYSRSLRTPITIINALGFLLPIIGLMFLPLLAVFMSGLFKPVFLAVGYCVVLPAIVYWFMSSSLQKRPYTFHQPDISKHQQFKTESQIIPITSSILISLLLIGLGSYFLFTTQQNTAEKSTVNSLLFSLLITVGISAGIAVYCILSTIKKLKIRDDVIQVERELGEVLFLLGHQLSRGIPIENALEEVKPKIKDLKISGMFDIILNNIKSFSMNFERAVFDKDHGAINYYPSTIISAVMKSVVEISKSGMGVLSTSMLSISSYLKDMHGVEESLHEILDEPTSSMEMQASMLAPIASGVIVSLTAIVMEMLIKFKGFIDNFQLSLQQGGLGGDVASTALSSMIGVGNIMPVFIFQLIVGIYMIEVVTMLSVFLSTIRHGEESVIKRYSIGKKLIISTLIYSAVLIFIYLMFSSVVGIADLESVI